MSRAGYSEPGRFVRFLERWWSLQAKIHKGPVNPTWLIGDIEKDNFRRPVSFCYPTETEVLTYVAEFAALFLEVDAMDEPNSKLEGK